MSHVLWIQNSFSFKINKIQQSMSQATLSRILNPNWQKTVDKEEQQHNCIIFLHIYGGAFLLLGPVLPFNYKNFTPCDSGFTLILYLETSLLLPMVHTVNPPNAINDSLITIFSIFKLSEQFPTTLPTSIENILLNNYKISK